MLLLLLALSAAAPLGAQWRLEAWLGDAWSLPSTATLSQAHQPDLRIHTTWSTRPHAPAWVYSGRIARWSHNSAWGLEFMHHKIYMDQPPAEVDFFRVTNGVNFILAERLWRRGGWEFGVGAGPVFVVPVSSVRGLVYDNANGFFHSRYELSGPGVQLNLARRLRLFPHTYGSLSLKFTATDLHLRIADGNATTENFALHLQYGLSLQTR